MTVLIVVLFSVLVVVLFCLIVFVVIVFVLLCLNFTRKKDYNNIMFLVKDFEYGIKLRFDMLEWPL